MEYSNGLGGGRPDWTLRCFPQPIIVDTLPQDCGCSWAFAPDITRTKEYPFLIKFPWRGCKVHARDYFRMGRVVRHV